VITATPVVTGVSTVTPTPLAAAPTIDQSLPETGIFDITGATVFGGGLVLAVLGILLAL